MPPVRVDGSHFSPDTRSFLELLNQHQVRYLIVGGEAVIFHGHARLTGDVDFFFAANEENVDRLFAALLEFWAGDVPGVDAAAELATKGVIIQFGRPPNRIDLINDVDGVTFEEAWVQRAEAVLATANGELPLSYIGLDALIRNKATSGRPKDLEDLAYLRRARDG